MMLIPCLFLFFQTDDNSAVVNPLVTNIYLEVSVKASLGLALIKTCQGKLKKKGSVLDKLE